MSKIKKKLHFYLLLELGTVFCYMCCNNEDRIFGGLMSHDCYIGGRGAPSLFTEGAVM